ncbi:nucleotide exchange factor GrpE [Pseudorhodoplanes sinuspersici]|uniref:Protein GrpE n=1 Tax=Pseudorhodoplanes sinuspersici TaxID=1235591 RepID=A0A1W6ZP59_9HYPH|nr:nucleotide exchange factor GrpE [Pseudorhodoplanes sinuspersici]ARP99186.1 nucleotide exchange factor GrpE [Pseudorhodoplanes sinuspersici]RKE69153.1 molecular chaperone GrpE [Pseudorhodoplanes sinuspersici]
MNDTPRPDAKAPETENAGEAQEKKFEGSKPQVSKPYVDPSLMVDETAEMKNRLLRALADMENLRKRTEREVADARQYGIASFARDILGVADNFRRALEAVGPDLRTGADAAVNSLIEGVELTERDLQKALEKNGIRKIEPQGEKFDPNLHQAMYEVPDPSVPSGTIVEVVQPGYVIGERILRPALVAVSKGGPKAAPAEPVANDNSGASK